MRKRNAFTILEQAVSAVPEFETMLKKLSQQVILRGQSKSTMDNYSRRIVLFVIYFNRQAEQVSEDEINVYLVALACNLKYPLLQKGTHAYQERNPAHSLPCRSSAVFVACCLFMIVPKCLFVLLCGPGG